MPSFIDLLNKSVRGVHCESAHSLNTLLLMPSGPLALEVLSLDIIFLTVMTSKLTFSNLASVK